MKHECLLQPQSWTGWTCLADPLLVDTIVTLNHLIHLILQNLTFYCSFLTTSSVKCKNYKFQYLTTLKFLRVHIRIFGSWYIICSHLTITYGLPIDGVVSEPLKALIRVCISPAWLCYIFQCLQRASVYFRSLQSTKKLGLQALSWMTLLRKSGQTKSYVQLRNSRERWVLNP